jgi:predicted enzyme related to lactoylglutathione lyase
MAASLVREKDKAPAHSTRLLLRRLNQTMKKITQRSGKICVPKMAIPKIGWLAYAEEPVRNIFGIIEPDTSAK